MDTHLLQIRAMNEKQKTDFFSLYGDLLCNMEDTTMDSDGEDSPVVLRREQPPYRGPLVRVLSNPYQNYSQLRQTLHILESYEIFTEEWKDEQKCFIGDYSELLYQIKSSEKMKTERYRKLVEEMEEALDQVIDCLLKYDDIEINFYTDFVKAMIKVYEYELDIDILCDQMSNM